MKADRPETPTQSGAATRWFLITLAAFIALRTIMTLLMREPGPIFTFDNDDAMRLVQVRDLIAGQPWFDTTQYRLGIGGAEIHWSRLVDAPLALLISFFDLFFSREPAENIVAFLWPFSILASVIAIYWRIGLRLGGVTMAVVAALAAGGLSSLSGKFLPGAFDHHNIQFLLISLALMWLLEGDNRPASLAKAGAAIALSLNIGLESLIYLAVMSGYVAVLWSLRGQSAARATRAFILTFLAVLGIGFVATVPADRYFAAHCDAIGIDLIIPVAVASIGLFAGTYLIGASVLRWVWLVAAVGATLAAAIAIDSSCLRSPYANLDPELVAAWLRHVDEVLSLWTKFLDAPSLYAGDIAIAFIALAAGLAWLRSDAERMQAGFLLVLLMVSVAIAFYQSRGIFYMGYAAILPNAWAVSRLYRRYLDRGRPAAVGVIVLVLGLGTNAGSWLLFSTTAANLFAGGSDVPSANATAAEAECEDPRLYRELSELPHGMISASSNLGAHILRATQHRALSAPYHRNQAAMLAQLRIENAEFDKVPVMFDTLNIDYLVTCDADALYLSEANSANDLYRELREERVPAYLERLSKDQGSTIQIYRYVKGEQP